MSDEGAPCPVCETELVHDEGSRGVCPHCGERLRHESSSIVVDGENAKGVEKEVVSIELTVTEYAESEERAVNYTVDRVETLLQCGRWQSPYGDDEFEVDVE